MLDTLAAGVLSGVPDSLLRMHELAGDLHRYLQDARAGLLSKLDGLSEYDIRRPLVPTGTNLLGLVKHVAGIELGYLVESVGREAPKLPWNEDGSVWESADMWAKPDESREYLADLYRTAWPIPTSRSSSWT